MKVDLEDFIHTPEIRYNENDQSMYVKVGNKFEKLLDMSSMYDDIKNMNTSIKTTATAKADNVVTTASIADNYISVDRCDATSAQGYINGIYTPSITDRTGNANSIWTSPGTGWPYVNGGTYTTSCTSYTIDSSFLYNKIKDKTMKIFIKKYVEILTTHKKQSEYIQCFGIDSNGKAATFTRNLPAKTVSVDKFFDDIAKEATSKRWKDFFGPLTHDLTKSWYVDRCEEDNRIWPTFYKMAPRKDEYTKPDMPYVQDELPWVGVDDVEAPLDMGPIDLDDILKKQVYYNVAVDDHSYSVTSSYGNHNSIATSAVNNDIISSCASTDINGGKPLGEYIEELSAKVNKLERLTEYTTK